jgi:fumarylacetoacetase
MVNASDPKLKSWVEVPDGSDFPIQNLPFGIFKTDYLSPVAGVAIGDHVLDLVYLHENGFLNGLGLPSGIFNQKELNGFLALGRRKGGEVRQRISELLRHDNDELKSNVAARELSLVHMREVEMQLPTTLIFTAVRNMPPMWDPCFVILKTHCCQTGNICR